MYQALNNGPSLNQDLETLYDVQLRSESCKLRQNLEAIQRMKDNLLHSNQQIMREPIVSDNYSTILKNENTFVSNSGNDLVTNNNNQNPKKEETPSPVKHHNLKNSHDKRHGQTKNNHKVGVSRVHRGIQTGKIVKKAEKAIQTRIKDTNEPNQKRQI